MEDKAVGTLIISLDFELFWGMQDCIEFDKYENNVIGGRCAIPLLLDLFKKYNIHATWATVGFMFADNYDELKKFFPSQELMPTYRNTDLCAYRCFKTIGLNEKMAPCYYASSLIDMISKVNGQEIASHTFSHFYCKEKGQTVEQFVADMKSAISIASYHGYELSSIVLPRNQCSDEYLKILSKLGFIAFRNEEEDWIHKKVKFRPLMRILRLMDVYIPLTGQGGYTQSEKFGMINLTGSRMYKPFFKALRLFEKFKILRIKKQMLNAAKRGLTFHLWWHPHNIGIETEYHFKQLEEIFRYYDYLKERYQMRSFNMKEAAQEIRNR